MNTKETLLHEFLTSKSGNIKEDEKLISKIKKYLDTQADAELSCVLHTLKACIADYSLKGFDECCKIAVPVFEHLENTQTWKYTELFVLATIIGYHPDFKKTYDIFQEALDVIADEHSADSEYRTIIYAMHSNFTKRMLRVRYFEPTFETQKLGDLFMCSYNYVMDICKQKNLPQQYKLQIRRGVFENNIKLVGSGLDAYKKVSNITQYKMCKYEIAEYLFHMDGDLTSDLAKFIVGHQLTKRMDEIGMSASDLAFALDSDYNVITSVMRGESGMSLRRLCKVARLLDTDVNYFIGDEGKKSEEVDPFMLSVKSWMDDSTDSDKELVLNMIELIMRDRYPDRGGKRKK